MGESGSGKTAVMARAAIFAREKDHAVIITRFLGTTAGASNMEGLLAKLNEEVAKAYGADINLLRGNDEKRRQEKDVFMDCLMLAGKERPLIIFLDALDQLPPHSQAYLMETLPERLPAFCKIVVSGTTEAEVHFVRGLKERGAGIATTQVSLK